jgi:acyl-homoserine-lactone acylase
MSAKRENVLSACGALRTGMSALQRGVRFTALKAKEPTSDIAKAIALVERWDNTVAPESKGAVLFELWWADYSGLRPPNRTSLPDEKRFAKVWTAEDPLNTPRGLADPERATLSLGSY